LMVQLQHIVNPYSPDVLFFSTCNNQKYYVCMIHIFTWYPVVHVHTQLQSNCMWCMCQQTNKHYP